MTMQKAQGSRLLIIDGHAVLHRAWHALPPLTTKDGTVISGAYGFTMLLLRAIKDIAPSHVAVTFDLEGPTFRHEEYEAYKATREEKPDELYAQIPMIEEILEAMGIPVYGVKGFEADDVIGTIAEKVRRKKDVETIIVTGDKDLLQLVDASTKVYHLRQGVSDVVMYGPKEVKARYGFTPEQLVDFKALRGDPSDNIPGVKGIGEKTATDLVVRFGSLVAIYDALDKGSKKAEDLKPSVRKNLLACRDDAFQALDLCRIRRDVKVDFTLKEAEFSPITKEKVQAVFTKYQFMKLLAQVPDGTEAPPTSKPVRAKKGGEQEEEPRPASAQGSVVVGDGKAARTELAHLRKAGRLAFRTQADDDKVAPTIWNIAIGDGARTVVFGKDVFAAVKDDIASLLADPGSAKVCHDLKRETLVLGGNGIAVKGKVFDVMIASYLLHSGERRSGLDAILSYMRRQTVADGTPEAERLGSETAALCSLADELGGLMDENDLAELNETMEIPLATVLARMERAGVAVDVPYLSGLSKEFGKRIDRLTGRIHELAGQPFNINSPAQLRDVLFEKLGLEAAGMKRTAKSKTVSTAASELVKLRDEHEIIGAILDYRELTKLRSTYIDALPPLVNPKTLRVHADFNQTVTATGRLSSSNPNLQNIPTPDTEYGKKVRDAFVSARDHSFVAADYSQIELRIAAHLAKEQTMIEAFRNGEDIHRRTAAAMFGEEKADDMRRIAKVINFGILYGMGPQRLSESADIPFGEAKQYIDTYFAIHKGIDRYMRQMREKIRDDGHVETIFGRKRFFRNVRLMNPRELAEAERQATNMPMQGSQADMIKIAMVRLDAALRERFGDGAAVPARMVIQVHDELVLEVRDDIVEEIVPLVTSTMAGVVKLDVPVVVDVAVGKRWGSMEKMKTGK